MSKNKEYYYHKGMHAAQYVTRFYGACNSWQRKAEREGYSAGTMYAKAQALIYADGDLEQWRKYCIVRDGFK